MDRFLWLIAALEGQGYLTEAGGQITLPQLSWRKCLTTIYGPDEQIIYQGYDVRKANKIWAEILKPSLKRWGKGGGPAPSRPWGSLYR